MTNAPKPEKRLHLRQARDHLIDILGLGRTWPLEDTWVERPSQWVSFEQTATVGLCPGAVDVEYSLHRPHQQEPAAPPQPGNGDAIRLTSPPIDQDITFEIRGTKIHTGLSVALRQSAEVKVGLDHQLRAHILDADLLDPRIETPLDSTPRVVDHGAPVTVEVVDAQEGVSYHLVESTPGGENVRCSEADVVGKGPGHSIQLQSGPRLDDAVLRVGCFKALGEGPDSEIQTSLLNAELPLAVRPALDLNLRLDPSPRVDLGQSAQLLLSSSQENVTYRPFTRPLIDSDFLFPPVDDITGLDLLEVSLAAGETLHLRRPEPGEIHLGSKDKPPFQQLGEPQKGTADNLLIIWDAVVADSVVIMQAEKEHDFGELGQGSSREELGAMAVALPTPAPIPSPHPVRRLTIRAPVDDSQLLGPLVLTEGEPGVFYTLFEGENPLDRPAYFHTLGGPDPRVEPHRGLGRLRLGRDFAISRQGQPGEPLPGPVSPILDLGRRPLGFELQLRARRARTGVEQIFADPVVFPTLPRIQLAEPRVEPGQKARIQVMGSRIGECYQPFLNGQSLRRLRHGNDKDLVFVSDVISQATTFELHVWRPDDAGPKVVRVLSLTVQIHTPAEPKPAPVEPEPEAPPVEPEPEEPKPEVAPAPPEPEAPLP